MFYDQHDSHTDILQDLMKFDAITTIKTAISVVLRIMIVGT